MDLRYPAFRQGTTVKRVCGLLFVPLAALATPAWGQTYRAEIAYTQLSGTSDALYLANSDGTRAVKVYTANKLKINGVDIAPGGGRVAFTDTAGSLWVLPYTAGSGGISPGVAYRLEGPNTYHGAFGPPDFSADGTSILYAANRPDTEIRRVAADGSSAPITLLSGSELNGIMLERPRWLRAGGPGDFVYVEHDSQPSYRTRMQVGFFGLSGVTTATEFTIGESGGPCFDSLDIAHTRHALLLQACSVSYVSAGLIEYDLINRTVAAVYNVAPGGMVIGGHFSADDTQLVYGRAARSSYVTVESVNRYTLASQAQLKLTKAGSFGVTDWKPDAVTP